MQRLWSDLRNPHVTRIDRRDLLRLAAASCAFSLVSSCARTPAVVAPVERPQRNLMQFPEKDPLILLTDRPPQLETPLHYFRQDLTPNEAFFVRWHLSGIPTSVDARTFRLNVAGHVEQPLALSLHDLRTQFEPVSLVAVNQCSGNSRSLYLPRVPGGQWGNGALGNARWTGVRLRDLLQRAGIKPGAVEVTFQGLDRPAVPTIPAFVKALAAEHAMDGEPMVAYAMNGQALPMLNGFPLRLVVPGWFATYWVKALNDITVLNAKFSGFWMDKAYRIPKAVDAQELPDHLATETTPINRLSVRSLFVRPEPDEHVAQGQVYPVEGIAMDSGDGIRRVEVSADGGVTWADADLDPVIGKYSWRRWRFRWLVSSVGTHRLLARATTASGQTQTTAQWNRSGYARNVIEHIDVTAS